MELWVQISGGKTQWDVNAYWGKNGETTIIHDPTNRANQHKGLIVRKERKGKIIGNPYVSQKFCLTDKPIDDCSRFRHTIFFALRFNGRHLSTPGLSFIFFKGIVFIMTYFSPVNWKSYFCLVIIDQPFQINLSLYKFWLMTKKVTLCIVNYIVINCIACRTKITEKKSSTVYRKWLLKPIFNPSNIFDKPFLQV